MQLYERAGSDKMKVFLLQHSYEYEIYDDIKVEETKVIGIYSSEKKADEAKARFKVKEGFKRFPEECFFMDEYQLDQDHWEEGFITWVSENDTWIV